nr:plasmid mobilization relaxosome protein MobC [Brucella anthropi]
MSKSSTRKATSIIAFRMTPDESDALRAAAIAAGVGPTTFARRAAFNAANLAAPDYEMKLPDPSKVDRNKLIGAVNKIGSNVNQIAKVANEKKEIPENKIIKALFAEVRELRVAILKVLEQ